MDSFSYECRKQLKFKEQLEADGFTCVDDPASLYSKIGTMQEVETFCDSYTPKLLTKLFPLGLQYERPEAFWLVPLWQIVRYNYIVPKPGDVFKAKYVIGVRKVSEKGFVPSLRLPLQ